MKAKRAAEIGRWRIIPGNHPSDRVSIEVPVEDLNAFKRVGGDEPERSYGGTLRTQDAAEDRTETRTPSDPVLPHMFALLQSAHDRLEQLNRQLSEEMRAQRQTAVALAGTESREAGLIEAVAQLEAREKALQDKLSA
jgi:hypothetical protein